MNSIGLSSGRCRAIVVAGFLTCLLSTVPALVTPASAQTTPQLTYELRVYQGGAQPIQVQPISSYVCGQAKQSGSNVNPTRASWDDPANSNFDCVAALTTYLASFPIGNYTATLVAIDTATGLRSAESAPSPFVRVDAPAPPTNVRIVR